MTGELEELLGPDRVSRRAIHDLWPLALVRERAGARTAPVAVVRPRTYGEVGEVLKWASSRRVPVIPIGAATGVCGAVSPEDGQIVLDMRAFDQVLEIDEHDLTARVQAGIVGADLEERLQARSLTLGHFPSSLPISTLGGLISTRSSGQHSSYYGNIEDMVTGLMVVRPDGSVLPLRPPVRSANGPALHQLFVGAEGSLGVIVEAQVRIRRMPETVRGGGFSFEGLAAGLEAMRELLQRGIRPFVLRLYDPEDTAFQGAGVDGCLLVVAVAGDEVVVDAEWEVVRRVMGQGRALGEEPWEHWLAHRFDLSDTRLRSYLEPAGAYLDTIEVAAAWSRLPELHREIKQALGAAGLALCHFSHPYTTGCCAYFTFAGSAADEAAAEEAYLAVWQSAMQVALRLGATVSHHHGVGRLRAAWSRQELGEWGRLWDAVRQAGDPQQVMNPAGMGGR